MTKTREASDLINNIYSDFTSNNVGVGTTNATSKLTVAGDVSISGVGSTALLVNGDARVTGILTVGTSSITLNGITDRINVGAGLTLSSSGIQAGIVTATTVNATTITGAVTGNATGLTGTPNITVGVVTATSVSVSGNVSIAGTLTYEDVTNIDSIGIVTARAGIVLGPTANTIRLGTGTTISSPASDTFTVLTGGSERVRVGNSGVGIGTNSAGTRLDVFNTVSSIIRTRSELTSVYLDANNGYAYLNTFSNDPLLFGTNNTERARISSTGGFSLGTTANPGAGAIYATGDITAFYSSDIRLKKDIEPISEPIKKLMEISGVTYKWNEEYLKDKEVDGYFVRETEVGVIAQEVEKVLPEVVATRENGYKAVRYEKLVALLIEAVKDQQHQIDELKARLEEI